ncbi:hypothetical protein [Mollivirus kamchatka]|nr:hypothetical protein [Mollivirus kamchatka]
MATPTRAKFVVQEDGSLDDDSMAQWRALMAGPLAGETIDDTHTLTGMFMNSLLDRRANGGKQRAEYDDEAPRTVFLDMLPSDPVVRMMKAEGFSIPPWANTRERCVRWCTFLTDIRERLAIQVSDFADKPCRGCKAPITIALYEKLDTSDNQRATKCRPAIERYRLLIADKANSLRAEYDGICAVMHEVMAVSGGVCSDRCEAIWRRKRCALDDPDFVEALKRHNKICHARVDDDNDVVGAMLDEQGAKGKNNRNNKKGKNKKRR